MTNNLELFKGANYQRLELRTSLWMLWSCSTVDFHRFKSVVLLLGLPACSFCMLGNTNISDYPLAIVQTLELILEV